MRRYLICYCGKKYYSEIADKLCPICGKLMIEHEPTMCDYSDDEIRILRARHRVAAGITED